MEEGGKDGDAYTNQTESAKIELTHPKLNSQTRKIDDA